MNSFAQPDFRAPETDDERRTRQLADLREMTELGMQVVRKQAARARAQRDSADTDSVDTDTDPAEAATNRHPGPQTDPVLAFARASNVVRQAIALENRVASGGFARPARRYAGINPDTRRAKLRHVLHPLALAAEPDRAARRELIRTIDERIDEECAADPKLSLPKALAIISRGLHIRVDPAQLPDEFVYPPEILRARPWPPPRDATWPPPRDTT